MMGNWSKNNKILGIVLIVISFLAIGGLIYASIELNRREKELDNYLVEINFKKLEKKIKNKESFILVITRTDCSHCAAFKPKLKEVLSKYDITAYEIATDLLSTKEVAKFKDIASIQGTPTTIFIVDGEEKTTTNRLIGDTSTDKIISKLKQQGYIKK